MAGVSHLSKHSTMCCVIIVNYAVHVYVIEVYYSKIHPKTLLTTCSNLNKYLSVSYPLAIGYTRQLWSSFHRGISPPKGDTLAMAKCPLIHPSIVPAVSQVWYADDAIG